MHLLHTYIFIIFIVYKCTSVAGVLPEFIYVCHRNDSHINACIVKSVEILRPKLRVGIPELKIPAMEPLLLGNMSLKQGPQGARIDLNLTETLVWGPSTFIIKSVNHNITKNYFEFKVLIPKLRFKGKYSINMNVILINVNGKGNINGHFSNFLTNVKMQGEKVRNKSDKLEYLRFNRIEMRLSIGQSAMKLEGLFGGDQILGQIANNILENYSDVFVEEIRPALQESLSDVFTKIANGITGSFTYDELFPE